MKKLWKSLFVCGLFLGIFSCSNINENSSLFLTFKGSDFVTKSSARNTSESSASAEIYIVASLLGDYTETKCIKIADGTNTIQFDSVPIGAEIYVEVNIYDRNPSSTNPTSTSISFCHIYTGTSEKQKINTGKNTINLSMQNLEPGLNGNGYYTTTATLSATNEIQEQLGAIQFNGYDNGKYQVVYTTDNTILSEGIWSANYDTDTGLPTGTIVNFKECAYRNYTSATMDGVDGESDLIFVERPVWKTFTVKFVNYDNGFCIGATKIFE